MKTNKEYAKLEAQVKAYRAASTAYDKALMLAFPKGAAGLVFEFWNEARKEVFSVENSKIYTGATGHVKETP